ncbi:MAG: hypothetical protein AB1725_05295 [Armatimonadota bacterium]
MRRIDDETVDCCEKQWHKRTDLRCDTDHWALALAEVSGARLLVSGDENLIEDFRRHHSGKAIKPKLVQDKRELQRLLATTPDDA